MSALLELISSRSVPGHTLSPTKNIDIDQYVTHLSKISQPQFHYDLFCLILHNMKIKMQMVKFASYKVRKKLI